MICVVAIIAWFEFGIIPFVSQAMKPQNDFLNNNDGTQVIILLLFMKLLISCKAKMWGNSSWLFKMV